jgi:hypothetical protein
MPEWNEKDKKRKNKIRKDAKFDKVKVVPIVRSLVGLGFKEIEIGIILGVSESTIHSWKQRYPQLFEANAEGKQIMRGILCAEMFRAAIGYDYEEIDTTYKISHVVATSVDDKNQVIQESLKNVPDKIVVHKKHQPGNAHLQEFLANNLMKETFPRNPTQVENNIITLIGSVEPDRVRQFAGRLCEMIDAPKKVESIDVTEIKSKEISPVKSEEITVDEFGNPTKENP